MMGQTIRAVLLASAAAATFVVRRANNCTNHGRRVPCRSAYRMTAMAPRQQLTQIAVSLLGDAPEPFFAAARVLARNKTNPRGEVPA